MERANQDALTRADVAQPAIGAVSLGFSRLLESLGIEPQFFAGHSYGEYVALCAAGAMDEDDLLRLSHRRGAILREKTALMPGGMAALDTDADNAEAIIAGLDGVCVANSNGPKQTVIAGSEDRLEAALKRCQERGVRAQRLPVACAFHSPLVAPAREPLAQALAEARLQSPRRPVYSNVTAAEYTEDPGAIAGNLVDHMTSRVRFREQVEAMYEAGARIFVEVGPKGALTGLVGQILRDRPHLAMPSDVPGRPGIVQLLHLVARLATHGVAVRPERLFRGRVATAIDLDRLSPETGRPKLTPTTWIINSVRNRPKDAPEPRLLGQARPLDERPSAPSQKPYLAGCAKDLGRASLLLSTLNESPCRDHQRQAQWHFRSFPPIGPHAIPAVVGRRRPGHAPLPGPDGAISRVTAQPHVHIPFGIQ